ncbi:amino acid adenylation domain-containing protein [Longimicrobium sp.]|uniref:amino acid adenylation domain-containing protein n=1 Tax=Longimicrobium sp. TaxID=2029185 RepID=UPI003B3B2F5F
MTQPSFPNPPSDEHPAAPACIHALFERAAAAHPERTALVHAGTAVSYATLNARANRVAHRLRGLDVGPEVPVALFLPRVPELVAALLGVLKAGGAYLPLDPAYPPQRVAAMLDDTRAPVILTHSAVADRLPAHGGITVVVDADEAVAAASADDPHPLARPENLAYVIYTSGSTGRPKGVLIEHHTASAVLHWLRDTVPDAERACALAATSVCFDVSVAEIFGTLCWGGTLVLVDDALAFASVREPVRLASMVPTAAAELLRQGALPATLRTLALGGEPVPRALADALYAGTGVERILNLYGPTEDTTYSTCALIPRDPHHPVTVGRPVSGSAVRVIDPSSLRPMEDGGEGELMMAGAGVTRGYLARPALTAERYLPDPLSSVPGARMYRTGDLGRRRADGEYDCLGRMDRQVKIRGFRVEPEEVEAALAAHPSVEGAAVAARPDGVGEPRLVAWIAPAGAGGAELRAFLRARLPEYMVPSAFVSVDALPRTPNGKIDRLSLAAPEGLERGEGDEYVAPRTPVEEILCGIWAAVLGVERVGVRDDFFALGGHSLRAVQIVARLRDALGVSVPLPAIFQAHTVQALAAQVERGMGGAPARAETIEPVDRTRPLPLSPAQEAVWFFERLSPGMRSYQFQASVRMRGTLDVDALRAALTEIVRRHEIFRTTFAEIGGQPMQTVHAPWTVDLPVADARPLSAEELDARFAEEFARPFEVGALPLVRWTLFHVAAGEHVLLVVEHHLVHDGWSFGVFLRDLVPLYDAFSRGQPSPLPEPALQFGDFAVWQRGWMEGDEAARGVAFWRDRLAGAPPVLDLPLDFARPPRISFRGESLHVRLDPQTAHAADAFSRAHGVTLYMTLLAAFHALIGRYTGQDDFVLGGGSAGRRLRESEELIGMIVNVIPLRADLGGDPDFLTLVDRVRRTALEAYPHQDVPFASIVDAVQPDRTMDRLPIFQHAFNMHHAPYPELRLPGLELEVTEALGNQTAKFDLQVIVIPRAQQNAAAGEEVAMIWEYATDLFRRDTVQRIWGHYQRLLASLLAAPARPVTAAPMMDEAERRRVIEAWNPAETGLPPHATVPELFAQHAARAPDAPAVDWDGRTMTYAELDAASDAVARRLLALRLGPEAHVGIAMERGPAVICAVLGVLKAGGAYVPLDVHYPAARLAFMLQDGRVSALIVQDAVPDPLAHFAGPVLSMAETARSQDETDRSSASGFQHAESLACILYTSGSTGTPRGIGITHRGVVRLIGEPAYAPRPGERVGQGSTPNFDAYTWEVWGTLLNGGCVVGITRDEMLSPAALARRIREGRIESAFLTTAVFNQLAREAPETFAGMRQVLSGGEAAAPDAMRRACRHTRVIHVYGPTENSTYSTFHVVESVPANALAVPIGRAVANSRAYVLDERLGPAPVGVPGELYVEGHGLARGYLGRPGLTARHFVPNPFGAPGSRLYRTGDRARWLPEGVLDFLGRADQQVKVRGFRIEPGEIEAVLVADPGVRDAVVVARADASGERVLAAYVVPRGDGAADAAALRRRLQERLPAYMVPGFIVPMNALPLAPGGKVDRRALPDPASVAGPVGDGEGFVPPATPEERAIAAVWTEVLGIERVGATDGFFSLGGHSLRAVRIINRIDETLGVRLSVSALFDAPTVRGLAERVVLERDRDPGLGSRLDWLDSLSEEEVLALLEEQEG